MLVVDLEQCGIEFWFRRHNLGGKAGAIVQMHAQVGAVRKMIGRGEDITVGRDQNSGTIPGKSFHPARSVNLDQTRVDP